MAVCAMTVHSVQRLLCNIHNIIHTLPHVSGNTQILLIIMSKCSRRLKTILNWLITFSDYNNKYPMGSRGSAALCAVCISNILPWHAAHTAAAVAPRHSFSAITDTPTPSLKLVNLSVHDLAFLLLMPHPCCDLDLWMWTPLVYWLWHVLTMYQIWAKSNNQQWSYCDSNIWPYDLEHLSRVVLCTWDNFHTV